MSDSRSRSWDDAIDALRRAANDLRGALSGSEAENPEAKAASDRLKGDISQLERAAADLLSKLGGAIDEQRADIGTSFDRERAERNAGQVKSSLEALAAMGGALAVEVTDVAKSSLAQVQPELKTAVSALDDVVGSAVSWVRATIDSDRDHRGNPTATGKPPLDDL